jgi:hypothetical protein
MNDDIAELHPRLFAKCRELLNAERARRGQPAGDDAAARMLAALVVLTAPSEGRDAIEMTDAGQTFRLPRHIRRMKLHRLLEAGLARPSEPGRKADARPIEWRNEHERMD